VGRRAPARRPGLSGAAPADPPAPDGPRALNGPTAPDGSPAPADPPAPVAVAPGAAPDAGAYDVVGPDGAPSLVLVHGTRLTRASWAPQAVRLRDEFRIVMPDLPGHGTLAETPFTLAGAADLLAGVIDEAAGGRAVVCGLSLGGYVAMDLAARSPERVAGLVLAGATQEPVGGWSIPYRALEVLFAHVPRGPFDAANRWFFRRRYPPEISEPVIGGGFWPVGGAAAIDAILGQRFVPRLAAYPGPVLVLNGSLDPVFRLGERAFLAASRDGRRRVLGGATHLSNLDRPDAFSDALRAFVRGPVARAEELRAPPGLY
jgi:pimeloyl-ACP methyl ester carboxylesterase